MQSTDSQRNQQPLLLIGGTGMVGRAWRQLLDERSLRYDAPGRVDLNLADPASIDRFFADARGRYRCVINCAAWTDVDSAEASEAAATQINGHAVQQLLDWCGQLDLPLVHYGTDYVFDGRGTAPYPVDHPIQPINAYGRSKAVGEQAVRSSTGRGGHLLIRTSWVYAPWAKNFVAQVLQIAKQKPVMQVLDDQRGRPTSAQFLVHASLQLIEAGASGTFHIADDGECSRFELAREIVQLTELPCRVEPCSSSQFPRPAPRPAYSVLDLSSAKAVLGPIPHWKENLARALGQMSASTT